MTFKRLILAGSALCLRLMSKTYGLKRVAALVVLMLILGLMFSVTDVHADSISANVARVTDWGFRFDGGITSISVNYLYTHVLASAWVSDGGPSFPNTNTAVGLTELEVSKNLAPQGSSLARTEPYHNDGQRMTAVTNITPDVTNSASATANAFHAGTVQFATPTGERGSVWLWANYEFDHILNTGVSGESASGYTAVQFYYDWDLGWNYLAEIKSDESVSNGDDLVTSVSGTFEQLLWNGISATPRVMDFKILVESKAGVPAGFYPPPIPEPSTILLFGTGLGILWLGVNRRRRK